MTGRCLGRKWVGLTLSLGLGLLTGCQTWLGGMTLPSPDYLSDKPDYVPRSPSFPLGRELSTMQTNASRVLPSAVPGGQPIPQNVPIGPQAPPTPPITAPGQGAPPIQ
jgi:hypothetical protein